MAKIFLAGSWNGVHFTGAPQWEKNPIFGFNLFLTRTRYIVHIYDLITNSILHRLVLTSDGFSQHNTPFPNVLVHPCTITSG